MSPKNQPKIPAIYDKRRTRAVTSRTDRESVFELLKSIEAKLHAHEAPRDQVLPELPPKKEQTPDQEEMLLDMVRASLKQYGTIVPPREAFYATATAVCPHCDPKGEDPRPIVTDFGFKTLANGDIKPQSWCKKCRNSRDSHPKRFSK